MSGSWQCHSSGGRHQGAPSRRHREAGTAGARGIAITSRRRDHIRENIQEKTKPWVLWFYSNPWSLTQSVHQCENATLSYLCAHMMWCIIYFFISKPMCVMRKFFTFRFSAHYELWSNNMTCYYQEFLSQNHWVRITSIELDPSNFVLSHQRNNEHLMKAQIRGPCAGNKWLSLRKQVINIVHYVFDLKLMWPYVWE